MSQSKRKRQRAALQTEANSIVDQLLREHNVGTTEGSLSTISPVLIAGIGGMGAKLARRVKARLRDLGHLSLVRFLVIDTDDSSQASEGQYPGFDDTEFCHLPMSCVRDILVNPRAHRLLSERLNLTDDATRNRLLSILDRGHDESGQIKVLALMAFYANLPLVQGKLDRQMGELRGTHTQLEQQLEEGDSAVEYPRRKR